MWRAVIAVLLLACARNDTDAVTNVRVELVDSVRYENELIGVDYLRRVAVHRDGRVDTLANVLTSQEPVVAGDSMVYGLLYDQQTVDGAFAFDVRTGATERLTLPPELLRIGVPRLAPDGQHLAYAAQDSATGEGYAAIARWPSGDVIYRSPKVRLLETDAGVDVVTWKDARRFEVRLDRSFGAGGGALVVTGSVDAIADVRVDSADRSRG